MYNMSKKQKIPQHIKEEVWRLYGSPLCWCCQQEPISAKNKHFGHIESEHHGGSVSLDNLRPICQHCNTRMGTKHMYEFMIQEGYPIRDVAIILRTKQDKFHVLQNKHVYYIPTQHGYDCAIGINSLFCKHPYLARLDINKLFIGSQVSGVMFYFVSNPKYSKWIRHQQLMPEMMQIERELTLTTT